MWLIKKIARLFIYRTDIWHLGLGFIAGILFPASRWITIAIMLVYLLYQHFEPEHVYESVKDTVAFLTGLMIAFIIVL